jgi:hypothetical protein
MSASDTPRMPAARTIRRSCRAVMVTGRAAASGLEPTEVVAGERGTNVARTPGRMRTFRCTCGARLFFENHNCLSCGSELGFVPDALALSAVTADAAGTYRVADGAKPLRKCANYVEHGVCNWMVDAADPDSLCLACRLNNVIPDLGDAERREQWARVESAKRRLVYSLLRVGLPVVPRSVDPGQGLAFDIKTEQPSEHVLTGHADGLITVNASEADPVTREKVRLAMGERYRTLLGHFRHEIGHYYWDHLIRERPALGPFRALFGDERADYNAALDRHYAADAAAAVSDAFISHYAAAHPWEDWAETFAHYLHIVDTLETAQHFGFIAAPPSQAAGPIRDFELLISEWLELTIALNALNRSMGLDDAYPFVISAAVREKLAFVHRTVQRRGKAL